MKNKYTKEQLQIAKRIFQDWQMSGDKDLIAWLDYQLLISGMESFRNKLNKLANKMK